MLVAHFICYLCQCIHLLVKLWNLNIKSNKHLLIQYKEEKTTLYISKRSRCLNIAAIVLLCSFNLFFVCLLLLFFYKGNTDNHFEKYATSANLVPYFSNLMKCKFYQKLCSNDLYQTVIRQFVRNYACFCVMRKSISASMKSPKSCDVAILRGAK